MSHKKVKLSRDDQIFHAVVNIIIAVVLVIMLWPLIFVVSSSLSSKEAVMAGKVFLLLLFSAAQKGDIPAQVVVRAVPGELMREGDLLKFRAVHEDDAGSGVGIDGALVVGDGIDFFPVSENLVHGKGSLLERVHGGSLLFDGFDDYCLRSASKLSGAGSDGLQNR